MNSRNSSNYLLIKTDSSATDDLFKLAIRYAENSLTVLYLSPKPIKTLPNIVLPEKEILKRIIFMYFSEIQQLTEKFLELHSWSITPRLIIVDSFHEFQCRNRGQPESEKCIMAIAALFNCTHYLERREGKICTSVVSTDASLENIKWQLIVDMFYYKSTILNLDPLNRDLE